MGKTGAPSSSFNLFQSLCILISFLSSMPTLGIEIDHESKPDIGSGKSLLDAISRAPLSTKVEKREIHRDARRGGRRNRVVVSAVNASSKGHTEERVPTFKSSAY